MADLSPEDLAFRRGVEERLGRPFEKVVDQLEKLFGKDWEEIDISISTRAEKHGIPEVDVVEQLMAKAEDKPSVSQVVRRRVVRWIGKPWRERENPWDKYKDRIPKTPPRTDEPGEEWKPFGG